MDNESKKVIEIFLGLILIILLVLMSLLILNVSPSKKTQQTITISNSFNTINYQRVPQYIQTERIIKTPECREFTRNLPYTSRKEHQRVTAIFGDEINKYHIYVRNLGYKGGYFTVKFHFKDYYGKTKVYSVTKYIEAKEERAFIHQNIREGKYEVLNWDYNVISESKETFYC